MKKINTILAAVSALLMLTVTSANSVEFKAGVSVNQLAAYANAKETLKDSNHVSNAEAILATNFLGIFFWLAFEEIHKFKEIKSISTAKSLSIGWKAIKHSYGLIKAQIKVIGNVGKQLKKLWESIRYFLNFDRLNFTSKNHQ